MSVMGIAQLDYQHGRTADLPWPVTMPGEWLGTEGTAGWALRELAKLGVEVPPQLRGPVAQVIAYVYEAGYGDG